MRYLRYLPVLVLLLLLTGCDCWRAKVWHNDELVYDGPGRVFTIGFGGSCVGLRLQHGYRSVWCGDVRFERWQECD
jgi:hypothetical protein